jgi:hypothetical protein
MLRCYKSVDRVRVLSNFDFESEFCMGARGAEESPLLEAVCQGTDGEDTAGWRRQCLKQ